MTQNLPSLRAEANIDTIQARIAAEGPRGRVTFVIEEPQVYIDDGQAEAAMQGPPTAVDVERQAAHLKLATFLHAHRAPRRLRSAPKLQRREKDTQWAHDFRRKLLEKKVTISGRSCAP